MATYEASRIKKRAFSLHVDGYLYYEHSCSKNRVYWNCRLKGECRARIITAPITDPNNIIVHKDHAPNYEEVEGLRIVAGIKRAAAEHPEMPPARIIHRELRDVPSVLAEIPNRPNLRKQVSRIRLTNMPANPTHLAALEGIPVTYRTTLSGDRFLLYDSFGDDEDDENDENDCGRIIIFSTRENSKQLFKCDIWFVDGTFKTAPSLFFSRSLDTWSSTSSWRES